MKKRIALLLAVAILAGCALTGCASKKEVQFGADVFNYMFEQSDTNNELDNLARIIAEHLTEEGIEGPTRDEEFWNRCVSEYQRDAGITLQSVVDRFDGLTDQYEKIVTSSVKAENAEELKSAVIRLTTASNDLMQLLSNPSGPGSTYREQTLDASTEASKAAAEIIELLQPYYQKPGFVNLQERGG